MRLQISLAAAALLMIALATWWFLSTYERVQVEVPGTYRGEARINPFFAAEKLLQRLGYDADSRAALTPSEWLPALEDTLVMRASPRSNDDAEKPLLRQWVTDGGHLVLLPPLERTLATDELVQTFGFRLKEIDVRNGAAAGGAAADADAAAADDAANDDAAADEAADDADADATAADSNTGAAPQRPQDTETRLGGYAIEAPSGHWRLERIGPLPPGLATIGDDAGLFAARREYGDGFVTAIADGTIFMNDSLARGDHARLFLDSVAGHIEPGTVWLVYDEEFPSLAVLIWRHARYFVLGAALWMLLWLWSKLPRFGPLVSSAAPARRSILEHIAAAARFSWRFSGPRDLVESAAAAVVRRGEVRRPGIARMPLEERAAHIGRLTREPAESVAAALRPVEHMSQREFTQRILELKRIRNEL